ncbi:MAG: signal peptide peptidase SppA [bacterium]|nr:signal peptide peptidase SppA [bacterium]
MERKNLAMTIVILCVLCLILGIFSPAVNKESVKQTAGGSVFESVDTTGDRIALLNIDGVISSDEVSSTWSSAFSTENFLASIKKAKEDRKVKAILIRINSPGGTVAASQDIFEAIIDARKDKPVVVSMADMAASGGYYVASAADRIVAQKGTMTGSIGVIFNFMDFADLENKVGINSNVIKSGKYKDSGSSSRKMTEDEKALFQSSIDMAYKQFIADITTGRVLRKDTYKITKKDLSAETLKKYADGRVFLGEEALNLGFVDAVGSQTAAVTIASEMAGHKKTLPVIPYNKNSALKGFLMSMDGMFHKPLKEMLPFSYSHGSRPLVIWE